MAEKARDKKPAKARPAARRRKTEQPKPEGPWGALTLALLAVVLVLRLAVNATAPFPVESGEALLWAYAEELDWGYFSAPPLTALVVRALTDAGGDGLFMLRLASPLAHFLTAWLIFLTGRRLWGGATGFWAAAGYTAAPGVSYSAMILSTDPVLLACWAAALYVWVRAAESEGWLWWAVLGALTGVGLMAGYAMAAFAGSALLCGMFSARERAWKGTGIAVLAALAVTAPNLAWNAQHGYAAIGHALAAADLGEAHFHLRGLAGFVAAQLLVIGPVFLVAIWLAMADRATWIEDWGMRVTAWQTVPLLLGATALAFLGRAEADLAAPAYVGGVLMAARWLVRSHGAPALKGQLVTGVVAALALWVVAGLYAGQAQNLTRRLDPFAETRLGPPFCELVLATMAEEGAEVLLSDDRNRLAECMYYGGLGWDEVAIWNPDGRPHSHHELVASLQPGDARPMLLAVTGDGQHIVRRFAEAREIDSGVIETHKDRSVPFRIWSVQGFRGYR